jgi:hypothetical protein
VKGVRRRSSGWRARVDFYMTACADLSPLPQTGHAVLLRPRRRSDGRPRGTSEQADLFRRIVSSEIPTIQIEEGVRKMRAARLLAHHLIDSPNISADVRGSLPIPKPDATPQQITAFADRLRHWLD